MFKRCAPLFLESPFGELGKRLWDENQKDFQKPLTKAQKLLVTVYLVSRDTVKGQYPPPPEQDQEESYRKERDYLDQLGGITRGEMDRLGLAKPFWINQGMDRFLGDFCAVVRALRDNGISPPARILELGCGAGWMSELLARCGYDVLGTTLDPKTVEVARRRSETLQVLGADGVLRYQVAAMEQLAQALKDEPKFDAVLVYEALHHVHNWRVSLAQAGRMLRSGGILVIGNEPNRIHTLKSYRVAQLTGTHEIGMSRAAICGHLRLLGFHDIQYPRNRFGFGVRPIWISARKLLGSQ